ncbi:morphogenetic protein associated with SpoVID [Ureibacillus xyleni]|uniref:Morphogenetic protein associated with SpoVID n=1 Tax=Ureibacillus xyleni TaxID=614648 RepID=A0A285SAQ7_9BACL|nr:LysM peptidoglycan-binding domain-containing protein [Ureibacillus xyleni]SOC02486.1 morphogenetic protein associated with SpoVID [Ureibacillus xyleni]
MRIHIVQKGETLWRIAKQYGIGLDELKALNAHLANPDYIVPGMEIILPDSATPTSTKNMMTKEQRTAPMSTKEMQTAPKPMQTAPKPMQTAPKEMVTQEMPQMELPPSPKEKMTQEMPAPMPAPVQPMMPEPTPMPQPVMPQFDMTPQFHLDFAPQMHFQQPQPQPMPMPQPQPIYIEMPDIHMQHTHMQPVMDKEKEIEYVPVPQPQIIYVPVMPHFYHHPSPCGCHEQQHYYEQSPCGCHEQKHYHQQSPCGCGCQEQYMPHEQPYMQAPSPCGCQGSPSVEMMPYGVPYFEPNYDISPVMDEDYPHQQEHDGLPDWLKDSSEMKMADHVQGTYDVESAALYNQPCDDSNVADDYHEMYELDSGFLPKSQAYDGHYDSPHHMMPQMPHHMMPMQQQQMYNMMPQQMYPNCQSYPYMNPYSPHYSPWKY